MDAVHGEERLGATGDWGYGPPLRLLTELLTADVCPLGLQAVIAWLD
ncbi:hypothetical protein [Streptomyces xanthophaeus]